MQKLYKLVPFLSILIIGCGASVPRFTSEKGSTPTRYDSPAKENKIDTTTETYNNNEILASETGEISFYAHQFDGKLTANGEVYDMNGISAAHPKYPLNTIIKIVNLKNHKSIVVRINDRMPVNPKGRILDASMGVAKQLDYLVDGVTLAKVQVLRWGDGKKIDNVKVTQDKPFLKSSPRYK